MRNNDAQQPYAPYTISVNPALTWSVHYTGRRARVCSIASDVELDDFVFHNNSPTPVTLLWLDWRGNANNFGNIPSGGSRR